jgi:predicted nucleic acid-binding protein
MVYADTSFLFSLVLHDANTASAIAYLKTHSTGLAFTSWQRCELRNAVHLAVWRGNCDTMLARRALDKVAEDVVAGNLVETQLDWPDVLVVADNLCDRHTAALGVRTLDLLHVAVAVSLGSKNFITCDGHQLALARASGLHATKI